MYHKIIAGYDPREDEHGREAVQLAAALAEPAGATVVVASVMDLRAYRANDRELVDGLETRVRDRVDSAMRGWPLSVKATPRLIDGTSAAGSLHELAEREGAGLIVVGSTHRGRVGRVIMGATAEHLLYGAPCGVAVAPREYRRPPHGIRTIGVAFDGSAESHTALYWAADVARALNATLHAIAVVAPAVPRVRPRLSFYWPIEESSAEEEARREQLQSAAADAMTGWSDVLRCEVTVRAGDPEKELRSAAEDAVDVLVTGSRGYGPLGSVLLGSVSEALSRSCPVPLLVVPRGGVRHHDESVRVAVAAAEDGGARGAADSLSRS